MSFRPIIYTINEFFPILVTPIITIIISAFWEVLSLFDNKDYLVLYRPSITIFDFRIEWFTKCFSVSPHDFESASRPVQRELYKSDRPLSHRQDRIAAIPFRLRTEAVSYLRIRQAMSDTYSGTWSSSHSY